MKTEAIILFACALVTVKSEPPASYGAPNTGYGAPLSGPGGNYDQSSPGGGYGGTGSGEGYGGGHGSHESQEPQSYEFGYRVKDDYSGSNFHQKESSDGNQVRGEYKVALPDGRTQIVTYWADWQTGFHADVKYEGQATYPQNNNVQQAYGPPQAPAGNGGYNYPSPPSNQYGAP
ncbi:pro-resilin-like [Sitophilus oryzae]|uniref:Pro-resilin-like n=1 Tax=Sitophilus oryzae TaxID=7048 RepID=A0A6J2XVY7_SITOR|nr:pro-resilin-like [Sitophilus oryzae]